MDGLWYPASIVDMRPDHSYVVQYRGYSESDRRIVSSQHVILPPPSVTGLAASANGWRSSSGRVTVDLVNDVGEVKTEGDDSAEASSSDSSDSDMDQDTASADPELLDFRRKVRDVTGMIKGDATAHAAPATGSHIASWEVHTKGMCKG